MLVPGQARAREIGMSGFARFRFGTEGEGWEGSLECGRFCIEGFVAAW